MIFEPLDRLFLDESKVKDYIVVTTASSSGTLKQSEQKLRSLLKSGQRRLHFKSERDSRRREILARIVELNVRATVWVVSELPNKAARDLCLTAICQEAVHSGVDQITIESDESIVSADRKLISNLLRTEKAGHIRFQHTPPHEHPLLWVSDALAWCYSSGGDWMRRSEPLIKGRVVKLY